MIKVEVVRVDCWLRACMASPEKESGMDSPIEMSYLPTLTPGGEVAVATERAGPAPRDVSARQTRALMDVD